MGQTQHVPAWVADLMQHPHLRDGKTAGQRNEGALPVCRAECERSLPSRDAGGLPNKAGEGSPPGRVCCLCKQRQLRRERPVKLWPGGWAGMPQQVVRASQSLAALSVCLARDGLPPSLARIGLTELDAERSGPL